MSIFGWLKIIMSVKKLQEMYEQSEDKEKVKISDYLKQYILLKEKHDNALKYIDEEISNLDETRLKFNLSNSDSIVIRLEILKSIRKML